MKNKNKDLKKKICEIETWRLKNEKMRKKYVLINMRDMLITE